MIPVSSENKVGLEAKTTPGQDYVDPNHEFVFAPYVCQLLVSEETGLLAKGTGFLVGKDLVLTCSHVVEKANAQELQCRFDVKSGKPGSRPSGLTVLVKEIVATSPYTELERTGRVGDDPAQQPTLNELDYALIRLARPFGEESFEIRRGNSVKRGWLVLPSVKPKVMPGSKVFILQHPKGFALKSHSGALTTLQPAETRLRYLANTEGGSSGSPCFQWSEEGRNDMIPVCLHNYGDPDWDGQGSDFNQGIPLHLIYKDLVEKGIKGLDDQPRYQSSVVHESSSFDSLPFPDFSVNAMDPQALASKVAYPDGFPSALFQLALDESSYNTADVDPHLLGDRLAKAKQELQAFNAQYDSEISRLKSKEDELTKQKKRIESTLRKIQRSDKPLPPEEVKRPDSGDPDYETKQLAYKQWQEKRRDYENELQEYRDDIEKIPSLESEIRDADNSIGQAVLQRQSVESNHRIAASDWDDRIEEARDGDISDSLFKMLDINESLLVDAKSYCQGFATLLAGQSIFRLLSTKVVDPSLAWQVRKEFEHHTHEMVTHIKKNRAAFSEDVLLPVAFANRTIKQNNDTLRTLGTTLLTDKNEEYSSLNLSLSGVLSQPSYQRSDYKDLEEADSIRAKQKELIAAKSDTELYLQRLQSAENDIPGETLRYANEVVNDGKKLTEQLKESWMSIGRSLQRLQQIWMGIAQHATARTSTLEFTNFNADFLGFANRVFDEPVVEMLHAAVDDEVGLKTGVEKVSAHPMNKTIVNVNAIQERRESEKLLLEKISDDIDGVSKLFSDVADRYDSAIKRYSLLSMLPGIGAWFQYKQIGQVAKTQVLQRGKVPEYDRAFKRAKRFLLGSSILIGSVYGFALSYLINAFRSETGQGMTFIVDTPLLGYALLTLCVLSVIAAIAGIGYWVKMLMDGTEH